MNPTATLYQTAQQSRPKRWPVILAVVGFNLLIASGLALGRLNNTLQTGQALVPAIASTLVLLAAAAGIPWCFEIVIRRVRPVMPLLRQRWNARINIWTERRRRNRARKQMAAAKALASAWTQESARITATYTLAYRLAQAKRRGA